MEAAEVWGAKTDALYSEFATSPFGLGEREAKERLKRHGHNSIPDKDRKSALDIFLAQLASPLLLILMAASVLSSFLGEDCFLPLGAACIGLDTAIILAVIFASVVLGFFQEYKSERVLSQLKRYFSYHATVMRGGEKMQIDAAELVPGDIVFVGLGDVVPADLRIVETKGILVNEAALTGESREVGKETGRNSVAREGAGRRAGRGAALVPQEIRNGLFMGTTVVDGYAKGLVVATGERTFFGGAATVFSAKVPESDFQTGIRKFGDMTLRVILVLTVFVFLANYLLGHGGKNALSDSALFALALAVGIAPEALPAVITITLSSGALMLARKKVITKKLAAIEDLGNMDVLCTDKTGTLTEEGISVERYIDLDCRDCRDVFKYAFLCNAAVGTARIRGNAIDVAIRKRGVGEKLDISGFEKVQEIPFDYVRRRMGLVAVEGKRRLLIVKGAPESVLSVCSKVRMRGKLHPIAKKGAEIRKMIDSYHREGHSTIGVAYREIGGRGEYSKEDERGLVFLGFVLFTNPPKAGVRQTLERLGKLNIRLKIISGDDPLVSRKLCADVGFEPSEGRVLLGRELREMNADEFSRAVDRYDVFARVTPDQKLAIVEALRANGHVVGFLGDGINDAPALRAADVGISVNTAADVAKGASHIILLQKSLGVVCDGAAEGRKIFGNITKYILNTMSANNGNMITVALSSLFLPFIPLLPSQILLNNLLSDLPLMSIASDNVDAGYTRKPQRWNVNFILRFMLFFGAISTVFDLLLIGVLYFVMHADIATFRTAWFLESLLSEMIIVFSLRTYLPFFRSMPSNLLLGFSLAAMGASVAAIYFAPLASLFYFVPLPWEMLALIGVILAGYFATTELGKAVFFSAVVRAENAHPLGVKQSPGGSAR